MEFKLTPEETKEFLDARIDHFTKVVETERAQCGPSSMFPAIESTKEKRANERLDVFKQIRVALLGL